MREGADSVHIVLQEIVSQRLGLLTSRNSLAEVGWLNFRYITNSILSLGKSGQHMVSIRNGDNSNLLSWRSYRMLLGQTLEVRHWAFSVSWGSDPISCSGCPFFLFAVSCEVVVPVGCQGSLHAHTGRKSGLQGVWEEHPGWGSVSQGCIFCLVNWRGDLFIVTMATLFSHRGHEFCCLLILEKLWG